MCVIPLLSPTKRSSAEWSPPVWGTATSIYLFVNCVVPRACEKCRLLRCDFFYTTDSSSEDEKVKKPAVQQQTKKSTPVAAKKTKKESSSSSSDSSDSEDEKKTAPMVVNLFRLLRRLP